MNEKAIVFIILINIDKDLLVSKFELLPQPNFSTKMLNKFPEVSTLWIRMRDERTLSPGESEQDKLSSKLEAKL